MSLLSLNLTTNLPSSLNFIIFPNFPRTPHFNYYSLICLFYVVLLDFFFLIQPPFPSLLERPKELLLNNFKMLPYQPVSCTKTLNIQSNFCLHISDLFNFSLLSLPLFLCPHALPEFFPLVPLFQSAPLVLIDGVTHVILLVYMSFSESFLCNSLSLQCVTYP